MKQEPHKHLRPLIKSNHWELLVEVLQNRLDSAMTAIKKCSPDDLGRLQGQVQELEYLLNMKVSLQAEENTKR